jgi:hypothetical protein
MARCQWTTGVDEKSSPAGLVKINPFPFQHLSDFRVLSAAPLIHTRSF